MENTKSKSKKKNEIKEHNEQHKIEQHKIETAIQKLKQYRKCIHKDDKKMFDDFFRIN